MEIRRRCMDILGHVDGDSQLHPKNVIAFEFGERAKASADSPPCFHEGRRLAVRDVVVTRENNVVEEVVA